MAASNTTRGPAAKQETKSMKQRHNIDMLLLGGESAVSNDDSVIASATEGSPMASSSATDAALPILSLAAALEDEPPKSPIAAKTPSKAKAGKTPTTTGVPSERLQRSRERNRIHARRTRQRKKEQMQHLHDRAQKLKTEQLFYRQMIHEKNTANILVGRFASDGETGEAASCDPKVDHLLQRPIEEIPDVSQISELPALILPGHHNSKAKQDGSGEAPSDGIDYELLGKDRSKCSPEELDRIRRERNRMHAKRTRDRKRLYMEEMAELCKGLEEENALLADHLTHLNGGKPMHCPDSPSEVSPLITALSPEQPEPPALASEGGSSSVSPKKKRKSRKSPAKKEDSVSFDQIRTLIEAATAFSQTSAASAVSASSHSDASLTDQEEQGSDTKRARRDGGSVPDSISASAIQC